MSKLGDIARSEPVRVRVYAALAPIIAVLALRGWINDTEVPYIIAALVAVLGVPAAETARARVVPVAKVLAAQAQEDPAAGRHAAPPAG